VRVAVVAVLLIALSVAAFAVGRSTGDSSADRPVVIDCVQRDPTLDKWPPEGWEQNAVISGPVAFYGARDAQREEPKDGHVSTELPVLVDAEKQVTISSETDGVKLGFGEESKATTAVTLKACPAFEHEFGTSRRVGEFTQFVGDFTADEPTCMELDLSVYGEPDTRHVRFGLGKSCD
jgi:hypothetical protein